MSDQTGDPLTRALGALQSLRAPRSDAVPRVLWDQLHDALLEMQREREALLGVAEGARGLVQAIDEYDQAAENEETGTVDRLGESCVEAEGALVDALYRLRAIQEFSREETDR